MKWMLIYEYIQKFEGVKYWLSHSDKGQMEAKTAQFDTAKDEVEAKNMKHNLHRRKGFCITVSSKTLKHFYESMLEWQLFLI